MPSVEEVFKILSADEKFIARVKSSLNNIMKDGKIDQYDAPELVFLITDAYNEMSNLHLTYEELPVLIKMLYGFIVEKFDLIPVDKRADFEKLVDVAVRLVMLQPKVEKQVTKCLGWLSCFKSTAVVETSKPDAYKQVEKQEPKEETKPETEMAVKSEQTNAV